MEPPPSPPVAAVTIPPATAAALPPDEPPGVRSRAHGLRVAPCSFVVVWFTPPNSDAVASPAGTAPAARRRRTWVEVWSATSPAKATEACVYGHPSTASSSLTAIGTPPKGRETSAAAAAARAPSSSTKQTAFSSLAPTAARVASSSSVGERSPERKASTSEQASPDHGASATAAHPRGRGRA